MEKRKERKGAPSGYDYLASFSLLPLGENSPVEMGLA